MSSMSPMTTLFGAACAASAASSAQIAPAIVNILLHRTMVFLPVQPRIVSRSSKDFDPCGYFACRDRANQAPRPRLEPEAIGSNAAASLSFRLDRRPDGNRRPGNRSCFPCPSPREARFSIGRRAPRSGAFSLFLPGNRQKERRPMRSSASPSKKKIFFFSILKQIPEPISLQSNVEITGRIPPCSEPEQDVRGPLERLPPRRARNQLRLDVDKQDEGRIFQDASY